ncbi:MAG: DUF721 domain-containing protein [Acidobacteriota bacterium]|nr:DUF721 domain-containing protein [Acidobacteriota bacterium]
MSLEGVRELSGRWLARSLEALREEDKLAAAWPVACGPALAQRGIVTGYSDGVVRIEVVDEVWMGQMMSMRTQLTGQLAQIAGVKVREIHFERQRNGNR